MNGGDEFSFIGDPQLSLSTASTAPFTDDLSHQQPQNKRRKSTRACGPCRKAHVTCNESRPCTRCVKRNMADSCEDVPRKERKSSGSHCQGHSSVTAIDARWRAVNSTLTALNAGVNPLMLNSSAPSTTPTVSSSSLYYNARPAPVAPPAPGTASGSGVSFENRLRTVYTYSHTPFDYSRSFAKLIKYVKDTMDRDKILRICQSLARIRPALISVIMTLNRDDLVLMEQCFLRMVLEFEKMLPAIGTPTALWRRTGEIVLISYEFSFLTRWHSSDLLRTCIYEIMDGESAVVYWEKFAHSAFDYSKQAVFECKLISPRGDGIQCACCFTVKCDIFDIPISVIGQFLPILVK
eukprot:Partr_v1_DN28761_c1_g1_i1_m62508 putative Transcription factor which regulates nonfermentable carbon utilization. Activator of gluconeogenetic genes (By similarity)